ncbi:L,D-transpeptidase [Wenxinia saemankumensis]|uniref:Lipoprotein-anchoring transpeptidase ErfK/SrfK n=1 Tax=Wenxinia saemankumensis TaxID=1447782 RepID=A0A1M6A9Q3_9RHOB|nr:L,D-transpeptidase [Wenxinia saemankumensis]SHI33177.1 Lipoprotein-anchoring transpeptidase ErfK/SrfK [Wenxinia saemankumensis]
MTENPRPTRRAVLAGGAAGLAAVAAPLRAMAAPDFGIDYLEGLDLAGYLRPSDIPGAFTHAFYVNTAFSGGGMQKMWVLGRAGSGWDLALREPGLPEEAGWSWPVSTGTFWPGNDRAGPTPTGVYNLDERSHRFRTGWGSPGMYRAVYIDLHYTSGRQSGVAMHGTTHGQYVRLGRPASHGCVRMRCENMDMAWEMLHPGGARGEGTPLWGEVPRLFASTPEDSPAARTGYSRDGTWLRDQDGALLTKRGYTALFVFFRDDL